MANEEDLEKYDKVVKNYFNGDPFKFAKHSYYNLTLYTITALIKAEPLMMQDLELDKEKLSEIIGRLGLLPLPNLILLKSLFSIVNGDLASVVSNFSELSLTYAHKSPRDTKDYTIEDEAILACFFFSILLVMQGFNEKYK